MRRATAKSEACAGLVAAALMIGSLAACGGGASVAIATPRQSLTAVLVQPSVDQGARLYAENCMSCHGDRDGKGGIPEAPTHNDTGHTWHHPDAQLRDWVLNGKIGFSRMPPQKDKLSSEQVDQIFDYVKTWWTPDQRATQEDVSKRYQESLDRLK